MAATIFIINTVAPKIITAKSDTCILGSTHSALEDKYYHWNKKITQEDIIDTIIISVTSIIIIAILDNAYYFFSHNCHYCSFQCYY